MGDRDGGIAAHARHDPMLIAAALRVESVPADVAARLATCAACARLHADLAAIAAFLPATSVPARPHDHTLTAADAARLRRAGLRAWFERVGTARDTVTRPLAAGFSTLGLVGLLLAAVPVASPAGIAASISPETAPLRVPVGDPVPSDGVDVTGVGGGQPTDTRAQALQAMSAPDPTGQTPLVVLSGTFLAIGGALFGVRRVAARQGVR